MISINENSIDLFSKVFAGNFSNKEQSQNNPNKFAHFNLYIKELPYSIFNTKSFYSEQSYNYDPWSPYRQAVHRLYTLDNFFIIENYQLKNSERFAGGGFKKDLLLPINREMLTLRCGCTMKFSETKSGFYEGNLETKKKCIINKNGKQTYLSSKVEISKEKWVSIDEGYDMQTNQKVWGSKYGAFEFKRIRNSN